MRACILVPREPICLSVLTWQKDKKAFRDLFYKGTNPIQVNCAIRSLSIPRAPSPHIITLWVKISTCEFGGFTNIQSIVTTCLLFFSWVLLPFPSFNWIMFLWFHFLLLVCFLLWLIFWVLWDFCFFDFSVIYSVHLSLIIIYFQICHFYIQHKKLTAVYVHSTPPSLYYYCNTFHIYLCYKPRVHYYFH